MKGILKTRDGGDKGFSLIEVLVALLITMIVMASVFMLLHKGQESFQREPEVADMTANARAGLDRISQDLVIAGYNTPASMAIIWSDGGGTPAIPDELTIVYADPDVPTVKPFCKTTGKGPPKCSQNINFSSIVEIDPQAFKPKLVDILNKDALESAYPDGITLTAIQFPNLDDPNCATIDPGIFPFTLTQPPRCTGPQVKDAKGNVIAACEKVNLNHNPGKKGGEINLPGGFQGDVDPKCAVIGLFHIVQYRINPLPPAENPALERRDLALTGVAGQWTPLAANIENLQIQYTQGIVENFQDVPLLTPNDELPNTYINRVRVTVSGRSESTNLQGATAGVFAAEDTHLRKTFTTTVSLRNQLAEAQDKSRLQGIPGWN